MTRRLMLLTAALAMAQVPLQFEVASVKRAPLYDPQGMVGSRAVNGRFSARYESLAGLIRFAYEVADFQVAGGPGWVYTRDMNMDRFHVEAQAPGDTATTAQIRQMVQALLAERFQLRFHRETRDVPVFELTVAPGGVKMKQSDPGATEELVGTQSNLDLVYRGSAVPIRALLNVVRFAAGRPVVDRTNLAGTYAFTLRFAAGDPPPAEATAPSIFTAVEEQLGLKLESTKAPYEVLVIDRAEPPSEN